MKRINHKTLRIFKYSLLNIPLCVCMCVCNQDEYYGLKD